MDRYIQWIAAYFAIIKTMEKSKSAIDRGIDIEIVIDSCNKIS